MSSNGSSRKEGNNAYIKLDPTLNYWSASDFGLSAVSAKGRVVLCCSHIPRLLQLEVTGAMQHIDTSVKISVKSP